MTRQEILSKLDEYRAEAKARTLQLSRETAEAQGLSESQIQEFLECVEPMVDESLDSQFAKIRRWVENVQRAFDMPSIEVH